MVPTLFSNDGTKSKFYFQVYVSRLQREVGRLQEQNRILKLSDERTGLEDPDQPVNPSDKLADSTDQLADPPTSEKCKSPPSPEAVLPDSTNE